MSAQIDNFIKEVDCLYKDERYAVRDNGAVLRYTIDGKKKRPTDNIWSFGKLNIKSGYLEIASVRIHRIVASAFHGEPPTKEHVVDHIDTNKQNNRPENLRWVTRLENILLNPITARRIQNFCGSVEAFLADPSKFRHLFPDPNYVWMCTVSKEEAQVSLERMLSWAKSNNPSKGGSLGEWIFNREIDLTPSVKEINYITETEGVISKKVKANFKLLGAKLGTKMKQASAVIANLSQAQITSLEKEGKLALDIEGETIDLLINEVDIIAEDIPGWSVAVKNALTVALDITISDELKNEGNARELVNRIQNLRKDKDYNVTDRIQVQVERHEEINNAIVNFKDYICTEVLAESLLLADNLLNADSVEVNGIELKVLIDKTR